MYETPLGLPYPSILINIPQLYLDYEILVFDSGDIFGVYSCDVLSGKTVRNVVDNKRCLTNITFSNQDYLHGDLAVVRVA